MGEVARERLAESADEEGGAGRGHADIFLRLAEEAAPKLITDEQNRWRDRLEADQDNRRAALACFVGEADLARAVRMVKALWRFWQMRGHIREGRERIDEVLALEFPESEQETLLSALEAAGGLTWWAGDRDACRRYYERAVEVARGLNDKSLLAQALYNLTFPLGVVEPEPRLNISLEPMAT